MSTADFLTGGGELGELIRRTDWTRTPLGDPARWPQSLKTCTRIVLTSMQPMFVWWGPELINLYNDAYKSIVGGKHPQSLGQPASVVWREIWDQIEPRVASSMRDNAGTYDEALLLIMERNGYPEETYYTFSYSPVPNDDGGIGGIICANTDDTRRVIGERQVALLREVAAAATDARGSAEACRKIGQALQSNRKDLPFALIYLANESRARLELTGAAGIAEGHRAAPSTLALRSDNGWTACGVFEQPNIVVRTDLEADFGSLPPGFWQTPPSRAAVVPIASSGRTHNAGLLVVGLNPFRLFDDDYRGFLSLLAGQISASIASAEAFEKERQRAEALAEIDRAKTAFFSNVSHEFRTPLTLLMGPLSDTLQRANALDAAAREDLSAAHRNGLRLLKLVNTLLDFSRIEAGRVEASFEPTDLAQYTRGLASSFRSAMEKANLKFSVEADTGRDLLHVDHDMWEKIVLNLLSNAFKYTLQGEIAVTLRLASDERSVQLEVRDTGVGIPAAEIPRLFERFHRVEGQHGRTHEGSGIGLALVSELVKLHHGQVSVESEVGRGSIFRVSIPTGVRHLPPDRIRAPRSAVSTAVRADSFVQEALRWLPDAGALSGGDIEIVEDDSAIRAPENASHVLLADDNADMRDYVQRLLAPWYEVKVVANGRQALAAMGERQPDLLITDVMMPEMDGFALVKALRSDRELRDIPIVMLSARAGEEAVVEGLQAGADDYLVKPFSARELLARVSATLEIARVRRSSTQAIREESRRFEILNRTGALVAASLDLEKIVQDVTDAAVELTKAEFGAFFYNVTDDAGESYMLYSLSGVPREAFSKFPMPRNTAVFAPTFEGKGVMRSDDILKHPDYGKNAPRKGMPEGHLPVRSYLAVPVISRTGDVLGGLFFGHSTPGVFTEAAENIVSGIAAQAAVAIDNSRLYRETKRAAAELRQLNETLEHRVAAEIAERTKIEATFQQAQKMDAIGQLTGGIAHDFNNLLTVVIGGIDGVVRRVKDRDEEVHRRALMALQGATRAAALTHRLLAFARRQPLEPKPTQINKLISGMSEMLRRTIDERISIETVLAAGLWWVSIDQNQLESALLNLAVNARDAMGEGGKLTIETTNAHLDEAYARAHEELKPGQYVMLAVTDTGRGMTTDVLAKAFEPFFTTKEVGHGTGLGLSQVYGFVRQSGGHVKIYSEVGSGTTVKIYLPRLAAVDIPEMPEPSAPETSIAGRGEVILIVEDEPSVRAYSIDVLRELGYRTLDAPNGPVALDMLARHPEVQVLFTDVGLPGGMNGRQLADAARLARPELKVLFTTGYARNAIVHQGRLDPGIELIVKPFTYAALGAKLRQVIEET